MDNNEAREILIGFNSWRRGEDEDVIDTPQFSPKLIGQAIDFAIQALGDGWVSVEDGLPEIGVSVIAYVPAVPDQFNQQILAFDGTLWKEFDENSDDPILDEDAWIVGVTHWQPLPPKPKQP